MKTNHTNAFLFVTHKINDEILNRYYLLQKEVVGFGKLFFLYHKEKDDCNISETEIPTDISPYVFNTDTLDKLDYEPIAETITPGSNHFPTLQFFLENPDFKYYWVIEYDVVYTGEWYDFFLNFNTINTDFISSHIERYPDKPYWYWWHSLHIENVVLKNNELIRSFNPIYRISKDALEFLNNLLKGRKNWGHHEVLIPTALAYWGFSLLDFGGNGEFVLPQFKDRFYLMSSPNNPGTMRDNPPINKNELSIKNQLVHPVKDHF